MNPQLAVIVGITLYKMGCLAVGSLSIYLGYRLFKSGIWGDAGDLNATFQNTKIVLKSAAPGTFFSVLGAAIIIATVLQGINFTLSNKPQLP